MFQSASMSWVAGGWATHAVLQRVPVVHPLPVGVGVEAPLHPGGVRAPDLPVEDRRAGRLPARVPVGEALFLHSNQEWSE